MPPTDPVIEFLDELQRLAEAIEPGERYTAYRYEGEHAPIGWAIHRPDPDHGHDIVADELRGKHATYFAALDRDVVLALVRVVREACGVDPYSSRAKVARRTLKDLVTERRQ